MRRRFLFWQMNMIDFDSMQPGDEVPMPYAGARWEGLNQQTYRDAQEYCRAHASDPMPPQFEVVSILNAAGTNAIGYKLRRTR